MAANPGVTVLAPQYPQQSDRKNGEEASVRFAFVEGKTLAEALAEKIRQESARTEGRPETAGKTAAEILEAALTRVLGGAEKNKEPFRVTEGFQEVFGEIPPLKDDSYAVSNVDGLF